MTEPRRGSHKFYRGEFFIIFYDKEDMPRYMFDNVREIVKFQGKELTRKNINSLNVELYRALKSQSHIAKFLTGELLYVYIINKGEEEL